MGRMLRALLRHGLDKLGPRYPRVVLAAIFPLSFLVVLGGVWLLDLYVQLETDRFWRILAVTEAAVAVEILAALAVAFRLLRPADAWLHGRRTPETTIAAWRALAGLPLDLIRYARGLPVVVNIVPISIYLTFELAGPFVPDLLVLMAAVGVVLAYSMFLRFFAVELDRRADPGSPARDRARRRRRLRRARAGRRQRRDRPARGLVQPDGRRP